MEVWEIPTRRFCFGRPGSLYSDQFGARQRPRPRSGRVWKAAVWGTTRRWTLTLATSLARTDTRQPLKPRQPHNKNYTACSSDFIVSSAVYRDRTCLVCKSTNKLLMWGRYSHIDTSPHRGKWFLCYVSNYLPDYIVTF
jgi:hypothetical protein